MTNRCPNHNTFVFGSIEITSNFDSGNLAHVQQQPNGFELFVGVDHPRNQYRSWFYFHIVGVQKQKLLTFTVKNFGNQVSLFKQYRLLSQNHVPVVWIQSTKKWERIKQNSQKVFNSLVNQFNKIFNDQGYMQFSFSHTFKDSLTKFAFTFPWSLQDNSLFLQELQNQIINSIFFQQSVLIKTKEKRDVLLVTISSKSNIQSKTIKIVDQYIFPEKNPPPIFKNKKIIFISARVHPGQIPSSHVMNGILKFLCSNQREAFQLRQKYVFQIVPIVNPDGVYRGNFRTDCNGLNLNRFVLFTRYYLNPNVLDHPNIYGIKKLIMYYHQQNELFCYLDLHAHAGKKGCFIYGNCSNQLKKQVFIFKQLQICLYPKLMSLLNSHFDYDYCNFTFENMYAKDRRDSISKLGSGRVAIYKHTKNPYCWTLQCNYNMSRICSILPNKTKQNIPFNQQSFAQNKEVLLKYQNIQYTNPKDYFKIQNFQQIGKNCMQGLLQLSKDHPYSRLPCSVYKNLENLKLNLSIALMRMTPFRFQNYFRKILTALSIEQYQQRALVLLHQDIHYNNRIEEIEDFLKGKFKIEKMRNKTNQHSNRKEKIKKKITGQLRYQPNNADQIADSSIKIVKSKINYQRYLIKYLKSSNKFIARNIISKYEKIEFCKNNQKVKDRTLSFNEINKINMYNILTQNQFKIINRINQSLYKTNKIQNENFIQKLQY